MNSSNLPAKLNDQDRIKLGLFGLAPSGVLPAIFITENAVRSYHTFSPLPISWRYIFCATFRSRQTTPGRYPALLSCGVRTFLD